MSPELIKGTLKPLILNAIEDHGSLHGYAMRQIIEERTEGKIRITEGALYPQLHRLEAAGLISSETKTSGKRKRKTYVLTEKGKEGLTEMNIELLDFAGTLIKFLNSKPSLS
jgi:PadR family transcriptional regulator